MTILWTDPPLALRQATSEGDYAIACITRNSDGGEGKSSIFRAKDLPSAQHRLVGIVKEGDMGRVYDKDGNPV